jgi:molecular chaperone GrpE
MNDHHNGAENASASPAPRQKTRAEERIEALDTSSAALTAELDELRDRAERAEQEAAENKAAWQRSAADFQNYRRRMDQQREEEAALLNEVLLLKLLAIADDFDRAIEHVPADQQHSPWVEGISAIDRKMRAMLESEGVSVAEPSEGKPFDPREHDAIAYEESADVPEGTVLRELQRGYRIRDRVLRPSLVSVAKGGPAAPVAGSDEHEQTAHHSSSHSKSHHAGSKPDSRE